MKNYFYILILAGLTLLNSPAEATNRWEQYDKRYELSDPYMKLVDNFGNNFEPLYGTRNFRSVLTGVQYRGGGNNYYHRRNKRDNENPLPDDGLLNLCQDGFSQAVYLYEKNFSTAPHDIQCINRLNNKPHQLKYVQISPFSDQGVRKILTLIFQTLENESAGPIYTHCWNGWHASGLISTLALRQFCAWDANAAVDYWDRNTDGNNKDTYYEAIRHRIREFQPIANLKISKTLMDQVCP